MDNRVWLWILVGMTATAVTHLIATQLGLDSEWGDPFDAVIALGFPLGYLGNRLRRLTDEGGEGG